MEETICNQIPLNTEKKDISTIGKKNNTFYCPDKSPFVCGSNTIKGQKMLENRDVYCAVTPEFCNDPREGDPNINRPFFFKEDGFITEKIECKPQKNIYSVFNVSPPKTPTKEREKDINDYVDKLNLKQIREEIKRLTGKIDIGTINTLRDRLKRLYKERGVNITQPQQINPIPKHTKPIPKHTKPIPPQTDLNCDIYKKKINDKDSLIDYYKKKIQDLDKDYKSKKNDIERYYKSKIDEVERYYRKRLYDKETDKHTGLTEHQQNEYKRKIQDLEKERDSYKRNIENNYYKKRLEGKDDEILWYRQKLDEEKKKLEKEREFLEREREKLKMQNNHFFQPNFKTDKYTSEKIIKKNSKGGIYIDVPIFLKIYGTQISGPQHDEMKNNEYYTFQNTDYVIRDNTKGIPEIIAEKPHGGKFKYIKKKSSKKKIKKRIKKTLKK